MKPAAAFVSATLRASLPLLLWAAHFAFCYVGVAVGCRLGWHESAVAGASWLRWTLLLASLLALLLAAGLLWRATHRRSAAAEDSAPQSGLAERVRLLGAYLALVGIAWTSVPVLALPTRCVVS